MKIFLRILLVLLFVFIGAFCMDVHIPSIILGALFIMISFYIDIYFEKKSA